MKEVHFKGGPDQKKYWFENCATSTEAADARKYLIDPGADSELCILAEIPDWDHTGHTKVFHVTTPMEMRHIFNWGHRINWYICERTNLLDENYVWLSQRA